MDKLIKKLRKAFAIPCVSVSLPSTDDLYLKAKHYTDVQCNLQNFFDDDEIEISRMRYMHGYEQAIKDFVNCNYNPDLQ
ncbi:MAG: hypothetical protein IPN08_10025 [Bacteroidales bacterium]|nr:hypothetical protein [Bacteroidales bacterium]